MRCTSPPTRRRARRLQRGFSLIELMYATGYFMIGLTGLVYFQVVGAFGSARAADISMATALTASTIEKLRVTNATTVLQASSPLVASYDRFGTPLSDATLSNFWVTGINSSSPGPAYFTVTASCSQASGTAYYEVTVQTAWVTPPVTSFRHDITMQTRIATE